MEGVLEMRNPKLKKKKYVCDWCKENLCYAKTVEKPLSCIMRGHPTETKPNWRRKFFL